MNVSKFHKFNELDVFMMGLSRNEGATAWSIFLGVLRCLEITTYKVNPEALGFNTHAVSCTTEDFNVVLELTKEQFDEFKYRVKG